MLEQKTKVTPEEYLIRKAAAEYKSEYIGGEIRAMAGGSENHSVIAVNVTTTFNTALAKNPAKCTTATCACSSNVAAITPIPMRWSLLPFPRREGTGG